MLVKKRDVKESSTVEAPWKLCTVVAALGNWSDVMDALIITLILGILATEMHIGPVEIALLGGIASLGSVLNGLVGGILVDRIGRRKAFIIGNILMVFIYVVYIYSSDYLSFLAARFVGGFLAGLSGLASNIIIAEYAPPERRGTIMGLSSAFGVGGQLSIAFLLAVSGVLNLTWRHLMIYIAAFNVLVAILGIILLKETPLWLRAQMGKQHAPPEQQKIAKRYGLKDLLTSEFRSKFLLVMFMALGMAVGAPAGLAMVPFTFSFYYFSAFLGATAAWIGIMDICGVSMSIITRAVAGTISDRIGRLNTIILYAILAAAATQLIFRAHTFLPPGVDTSFMIFIAIWAVGYVVGNFGTSITEIIWGNELFPTHIRGSVTGFSTIIGGLLTFLGSTILGLLASAIGYGQALATLALIGLTIPIVGAIAGKKLNFETKGKVLE